jgi:hypothetical protein
MKPPSVSSQPSVFSTELKKIAGHGPQPPKITPTKPIGFSEKKENNQGRQLRH